MLFWQLTDSRDSQIDHFNYEELFMSKCIDCATKLLASIKNANLWPFCGLN